MPLDEEIEKQLNSLSFLHPYYSFMYGKVWMIKDTNFFLSKTEWIFGGRGRIWWAKNIERDTIFGPYSFQTLFNELPNEIRQKVMWHFDLLMSI